MNNSLVPTWILNLKKGQYIYNYRGQLAKIKKINNYYITILPNWALQFVLARKRFTWMSDYIYSFFSLILFWRRRLVDRILYLDDKSETSALLCSKEKQD